jgi:AAA15 family ATPase/GTPase
MKIRIIKIKNFRSYKDEVEIGFGDLTTFVGKNL